MTDRPAVTEEEIVEAAGAYAAQFCLKPTGLVAQDFTAGARFALAACFSQSKRVAVEAKIEVLEEEDAHMVAFLGGTYTDENREWRQAKIAALRKELGS